MLFPDSEPRPLRPPFNTGLLGFFGVVLAALVTRGFGLSARGVLWWSRTPCGGGPGELVAGGQAPERTGHLLPPLLVLTDQDWGLFTLSPAGVASVSQLHHP